MSENRSRCPAHVVKQTIPRLGQRSGRRQIGFEFGPAALKLANIEGGHIQQEAILVTVTHLQRQSGKYPDQWVGPSEREIHSGHRHPENAALVLLDTPATG